MDMVFIYALQDPSTKHIFYVGRSLRPGLRLNDHISGSGCIPEVRAHIVSIGTGGAKPQMVILEEVPLDRGVEREQYWITHLADQGEPLVNKRVPH